LAVIPGAPALCFWPGEASPKAAGAFRSTTSIPIPLKLILALLMRCGRVICATPDEGQYFAPDGIPPGNAEGSGRLIRIYRS
jgi:hypothetical protein